MTKYNFYLISIILLIILFFIAFRGSMKTNIFESIVSGPKNITGSGAKTNTGAEDINLIFNNEVNKIMGDSFLEIFKNIQKKNEYIDKEIKNINDDKVPQDVLKNIIVLSMLSKTLDSNNIKIFIHTLKRRINNIVEKIQEKFPLQKKNNIKIHRIIDSFNNDIIKTTTLLNMNVNKASKIVNKNIGIDE
jgi:hypothetical protein